MSHFLQLLATIALVPGALGATLIASHFSGGVYTLSLTGTNTSGTLSIASQTNGCGNMPAWIQYYGDTRKLYCFDEAGSGNGVLAEYSVANNGRLSRTGQGRTLGNTVYGRLYGGTDGKGFVVTAEYTPSTISTYKLPLSGNSALAVTKFTLAQHGPNTRQDAPHPHEVQLDPTGKFILNPDLGADIVRIFKIDASSGQLTLCGQGQAGAGDGPRHIEFWKSASGVQKAFTVNELGNSVTAWDMAYPSDNSGCLSLKRTQTLSTYAPGKKGGPTTKAAELRLVGNFLYVTNRADETFGTQQDSIAIYTIDPKTGAITWLEAANSYSYYPRTFQFNQDGSLLAVGGQTSSNVAIIPRDPATGKLGKLLATIQVAQKGTAGGEDGLSAVVWAE